MTMIMSQTISKEASYGWFADAIGGIAAAVLAIIGLVGVHPELMISIATIIFGVALLIEGGTVITEYAHIIFPAGRAGAVGNEFSGGGISAVFAAGIAGIVLGILALVGIHPAVLTAIAAIAFGCALVFSSNAVRHLRVLRQSAAPAREWQSGSDMLAAEMASGSTGMQVLAGIAGIVLGILALILTASGVLTLTSLLVLGTTIVLTGTAASEASLSVMQPYMDRTTTDRPTMDRTARSSPLSGPAE